MDTIKITITSNAFEEMGKIPEKYTGRGQDISPELQLHGLSDKARTIAIIMDDITHPIFKIYNHWTIWNIPAREIIPENISHGKYVDELNGAMQGVGYGKHKYRGPKPPFNASHLYEFTVYVLDTKLDLPEKTKKKDLLNAIEGHVLQMGRITGEYK